MARVFSLHTSSVAPSRPESAHHRSNRSCRRDAIPAPQESGSTYKASSSTASVPPECIATKPTTRSLRVAPGRHRPAIPVDPATSARSRVHRQALHRRARLRDSTRRVRGYAPVRSQQRSRRRRIAREAACATVPRSTGRAAEHPSRRGLLLRPSGVNNQGDRTTHPANRRWRPQCLPDSTRTSAFATTLAKR
jgi:hypothetical protein